MKKTGLLCCIVMACLFGGCIQQTEEASVQYNHTAPKTVFIVQDEKEPDIAEGQQDETLQKEEETPEPLQAPLNQPGSDIVKGMIRSISLSVTDGSMYGTKIVCWIDGFGLCYDISVQPEMCEVIIEEGALPEDGPFETHRLLLQTRGETHCLAELRFDPGNPKNNDYGVCYDIIIMDSDLVDMRPISADWESIAPMNKDGETVFDNVHIGIITAFDSQRNTVDLLTVEAAQTDADVGVAFLPETLSDEPVTLHVTDDSVLAVNGDEYEMLLTRDRFFTLLEQGYIGFLTEEGEDYFVGCYMGYAMNQLNYLCEIAID